MERNISETNELQSMIKNKEKSSLGESVEK
jgi:hypothetical protein